MRCCLALVLLAAAASPSFGQEFERIFNGKDLAGWEGDPKHWSVKDGAITGVTKENIPFNSFIIWRGGEIENFELRLKFRIEGNNSGVNFRSKELKDVGPFVVAGYQADIDVKGQHTGNLYEERGRTFLALRGQKVIIDAAGDRWQTGALGDNKKLIEDVDHTKWNEMTIVAVGNKITHTINGKTMVEVVDHQADARALKGVLAFQVHRGPVMEVQFKDIELKKLPAGKVLKPEDAPIPEGSTKLPANKKPVKKP
jgi:hypothetical protein